MPAEISASAYPQVVPRTAGLNRAFLVSAIIHGLLVAVVVAMTETGSRHPAVESVIVSTVSSAGSPSGIPRSTTPGRITVAAETQVPPPSATAETPDNRTTPLRFGVSMETLAAPADTGNTVAPSGNTLAVPPETGINVPGVEAVAYAGMGDPTTSPQRYVPLSSVTQLPRFRDFSPPAYPPQAWHEGREAVVKVEVDIEADGTVSDVRPAHGEEADTRFLAAAMDSVRKARFDPARRGSEPVAVRAILPVRFELRR